MSVIDNRIFREPADFFASSRYWVRQFGRPPCMFLPRDDPKEGSHHRREGSVPGTRR